MHDSSCNDDGPVIGSENAIVTIRKHTAAPAYFWPNAMPSYTVIGGCKRLHPRGPWGHSVITRRGTNEKHLA